MARYKKNSKINSGGFGIVYRATRLDDSQEFAWKELASAGLPEDEKQRFVREVRIQSKLDHPNIVPIVGLNLTTDPPWFIMPLARSSLRSELTATAGNQPKVVSIFNQILKGIAYAHENGVIHRDLKPENILFFDPPDFWDDELVKIGDFGLGKRLDFESITITRSSENLGTAAYMPPEQFSSFKTVDRRGDIFSLGKILYELLTGDFPLHVDVKSPKIPGGYGFIISKCLQHDAKNRYNSVSELRDDFALLTKSPKKFEKPIHRAEELLNEILGGDGDAKIKELDELFQAHESDEVLFTKFFPKLPREIVERYHEMLQHRFYERLRRFDSLLKDSLPFNYTDDVADFYEIVFRLTSDGDMMRLILSRVLDMGFKHNRYHVRSVFIRMLENIKDGSVALIARDVLRQNCHATVWCETEAASTALLLVIHEAIRKCVEDSSSETSE
jgi:serine/threonine protein kinase